MLGTSKQRCFTSLTVLTEFDRRTYLVHQHLQRNHFKADASRSTSMLKSVLEMSILQTPECMQNATPQSLPETPSPRHLPLQNTPHSHLLSSNHHQIVNFCFRRTKKCQCFTFKPFPVSPFFTLYVKINKTKVLS